MFKLGRNLFRHYKKLAAIRMLESENKVGLQSTRSFWNQESIHPNGYVNILKQRDFKLLGRSIDINIILAQMVNQYLRHSIDVAISRFESSDLTYILEMDSLIQNCRITHEMLSEYLVLEKFDDLFKELNECVAPCENNGRIVSHAVQELVSDVVTNYCFNNVTSRFLRSAVFYAEPIQRPNFPNAKLMYLYGTKGLSIEFSLKFGIYKDFIGEQHFQSLVRLIGPSGLALVFSELSNHVTLIVSTILTV
jgi:cytoplasmic FMR1 interacting protein